MSFPLCGLATRALDAPYRSLRSRSNPFEDARHDAVTALAVKSKCLAEGTNRSLRDAERGRDLLYAQLLQHTLHGHWMRAGSIAFQLPRMKRRAGPRHPM